MLTPDDVKETGLLGGLAAAVIGLGFGLRKMLTAWKVEEVAAKQADAQVLVVGQLNNELTRMHAHNAVLVTELNKLQLNLLELTQQLNTLRSENHQMRLEMHALRDELERVQSRPPSPAPRR